MEVTKYDYFLVYYKGGNHGIETEREDGIFHFLNNEGFGCAAGFWGCPWYFVDIVTLLTYFCIWSFALKPFLSALMG